MNKHNIRTPATAIDDVQAPQHEPKELEKEKNNMFRIVGLIGDHYIVKTHKGLKKGKISGTEIKNINDEIKIEKL